MSAKPPTICDRCGRPVLAHYTPIGRAPVHVETAAVVHSFYGCDSGCCGHRVVGYNCDGIAVEEGRFEFDHPSGESREAFAERMVRAAYGDSVTVRLDECEILDD